LSSDLIDAPLQSLPSLLLPGSVCHGEVDNILQPTDLTGYVSCLLVQQNDLAKHTNTHIRTRPTHFPLQPSELLVDISANKSGHRSQMALPY
jgi:hypothetical protein